MLLRTFKDGKFHFFPKSCQPENCPNETRVKIGVVSVLTKQHLLKKQFEREFSEPFARELESRGTESTKLSICFLQTSEIFYPSSD